MSQRTRASRSLSIVKTGLFMISNAMIVHEALAVSGAVKSLSPLAQIDHKDPVGWLINEWSKVLSTNYRMVFEPAIKLLKSLPSHHVLQNVLISLSNTARKAVANRAIFRHDLAGRLYHTLLLRDIAKGLATYYTSIPAATILASLALDHVNMIWEDIERIRNLRVADYACGSGTLLSAVYTEIMDRHIVHARGRPQISNLHKVLLEEVLYGFDVLEYAMHLTATSLVLRDPTQAIRDTNTFVVPLGVVNGIAYLGSLSMEVENNMVKFPSVRTLTGTVVHPVVKEGVEVAISTPFKMEKPHLVIMNPPFARTGNVGKSSLFGHLPRADRKDVLEELKRLGERIAVRYNLRGRFGRAGLAAFFLMKSYEASRNDGVLAFVLPRVFLSGSDWSSVREFLARNGKFRYVIVSDDPSVYWAWSENTNLSEILVVYTKNSCHTCRDSTTTVVYVRKRPRSALEAKIYSRLIKTLTDELNIETGKCFSSTYSVKIGGETAMYMYKVSDVALRRVAEVNLNLVMGFHSSFLSEIAYDIYLYRKFLDKALPLVPLKEYVAKKLNCKKWEDCVGYDVAGVRRKCVNKGTKPVMYLDALNMSTFSSLRVPRDVLKVTYVPDDCEKRTGRLLIAGVARLWLPTVGVIASYFDEPVLSQVAWSIPLDPEDARVQTLWLNSTLGLIHFMSLRQDSKGGFIQLKKKSLGELLLIDTNKLSEDTKRKLIQLFDSSSETKLEDIYTQLVNASKQAGHRFRIDIELLQTLGLAIDERAKNTLLKLYEELSDETLFKRFRPDPEPTTSPL